MCSISGWSQPVMSFSTFLLDVSANVVALFVCLSLFKVFVLNYWTVNEKTGHSQAIPGETTRGWNTVVFNQLEHEEIQMCCMKLRQVIIIIRQYSSSLWAKRAWFSMKNIYESKLDVSFLCNPFNTLLMTQKNCLKWWKSPP